MIKLMALFLAAPKELRNKFCESQDPYSNPGGLIFSSLIRTVPYIQLVTSIGDAIRCTRISLGGFEQV